jgi:hypothetical protein
MLDCEHHVTLIKALTFIYNTLHMYLEKPRRRFMQEIIFKRFFFKFFLHWHPQVRGIYHQLIIFKVRPHTRAYQSPPSPSPPNITPHTTHSSDPFILTPFLLHNRQRACEKSSSACVEKTSRYRPRGKRTGTLSSRVCVRVRAV